MQTSQRQRSCQTGTMTKIKQSDTVDNKWEWSRQGGLSYEGTFKLRMTRRMNHERSRWNVKLEEQVERQKGTWCSRGTDRRIAQGEHSG